MTRQLFDTAAWVAKEPMNPLALRALREAVDAHFASRSDGRHNKIRMLANELYGESGKLEIDADATISEGGDNGAYVQAWVWVPFAQTSLDKEADEGKV